MTPVGENGTVSNIHCPPSMILLLFSINEGKATVTSRCFSVILRIHPLTMSCHPSLPPFLQDLYPFLQPYCILQLQITSKGKSTSNAADKTWKFTLVTLEGPHTNNKTIPCHRHCWTTTWWLRPTLLYLQGLLILLLKNCQYPHPHPTECSDPRLAAEDAEERCRPSALLLKRASSLTTTTISGKTTAIQSIRRPGFVVFTISAQTAQR